MLFHYIIKKHIMQYRYPKVSNRELRGMTGAVSPLEGDGPQNGLGTNCKMKERRLASGRYASVAVCGEDTKNTLP